MDDIEQYSKNRKKILSSPKANEIKNIIMFSPIEEYTQILDYYIDKDPIIKKHIEESVLVNGSKQKVKLLITKWNLSPNKLSKYLALPSLSKRTAEILLKYGAIPDADCTREVLFDDSGLLELYLENGGKLEDLDEETWDTLLQDENLEILGVIANSDFIIDMSNLSFKKLHKIEELLEEKLDVIKKLEKIKSAKKMKNLSKHFSNNWNF